MTYKAVAFDMDGTLLNNARVILPETLDAIERIQAKGIEVVLVTGRHHSLVHPYYHQLKLTTPVVCCNGSYLYNFQNNQISFSNDMTKEQANFMLALVKKYGIHTLIYTDKTMTFEVLDDHLQGVYKWINSLPESIQPKMEQVENFEDVINNAEQIFKFATSAHDLVALQEFEKEVAQHSEFIGERSWINRVDVSARGSSKGHGLIKWAELVGIDIKDIVAFGDNENDISMLKAVGRGVAMGNAEKEIHAIADQVIGNNNEPSIARELEDLFL